MAEINEQLDRISDLPDTLLSLILSFLPTKQAVATMVLSKRWKGIWTEVPALNFYGINMWKESILTFVDTVLMLNVAPSIHRFKLNCCITKKTKENNICSWIMNAMRRDIFEIDLTLDTDSRIGSNMLLPEVVFVYEKLRVLKLKSWTLPLTPKVHLPNLVTLHFDSVTFTDESTLEYLLSRLPCLEELMIKYSKVKPTFRICSSSLKRLSVIKFERYCFAKVTTGKLILATPSLEYLCINDASLDHEFDSMPSLVEAKIDIEYPSKLCTVNVSKLISLLSHISHVKRLIIADKTILTSSFNFDFDQPLSFPNLTHLTVSWGFKFKNHPNFWFWFWFHLVLWIMQHAPNLTSFNYWCRSCTDEGDHIHVPVLPTSLSKNGLIPTLKVVTIHLFDGGRSDTLLMEYLLKNATLLQMMRIKLRSVASSARVSDAIERLSQVSRASSSVCKLAYCVRCRQHTFVLSELVDADCKCPDNNHNSKKRKIS